MGACRVVKDSLPIANILKKVLIDSSSDSSSNLFGLIFFILQGLQESIASIKKLNITPPENAFLVINVELDPLGSERYRVSQFGNDSTVSQAVVLNDDDDDEVIGR